MEKRDLSRPAMADRVRRHFEIYRFTRWARDAQPTARVFVGAGDDIEGAAPFGVAHFIIDYMALGYLMLRGKPVPNGEPGVTADFVAVRTEKAWPRSLNADVLADRYLELAERLSLDDYRDAQASAAAAQGIAA